MAICAQRWWRPLLSLTAAGVVVVAGLNGCGKKGTPVSTETSPGTANSGSPAGPGLPLNAKLSQPFAEATLAEPPERESEVVLPDVTLTNKSVGKVYEEVVKTWDQVPLVSADGKRWTYVATLDTELGPIEITLLPDVAPNHVRNFVTLAKVGYFDGLVFERIIHQKSDAEPNAVLSMIEGGCPVGTGAPGFGSIGYWLKAEFSEQVKHEEGSVGACLGETADSAGCRFYITLTKAPALDGERTIFGKVTRGLDVVRRISTQPIMNAPEFPDGTHPEHPTLIRKVTIRPKEANAGTAGGK
jgi:peptidyl-prolyl cis-trans isomerase B (cyclophilin B)